ncbi:MAG TPA: hypothetical protein VFT16_05595 [Candidatus Saccharimonadales bacterium]|nr:hypothetical protein [Candidatus Saccharimonadales bacterium]
MRINAAVRMYLALEEISKNTVSNIRECFAIIRQHTAWKKVGVLSADFHIPRIQALCQLVQEKAY